MTKRFLSILLFLFTVAAFAGDYERDAQKKVVTDHRLNLIWQDDGAGIERDFYGAKAYCRDLELAGYDDWYLPSVTELRSLVRQQNYPRAIEATFHNLFNDYYWSSSEYSDPYAWMVLFIYDDVIYYKKSARNYVRCVRKARMGLEK